MSRHLQRGGFFHTLSQSSHQDKEIEGQIYVAMT